MREIKLIVIGLLTALSLWISGCDEEEDRPEVLYYGPQPCADDAQCVNDAQCVEENGEGWVCDTDHEVVPEGCGDTWPTCVQAED